IVLLSLWTSAGTADVYHISADKNHQSHVCAILQEGSNLRQSIMAAILGFAVVLFSIEGFLSYATFNVYDTSNESTFLFVSSALGLLLSIFMGATGVWFEPSVEILWGQHMMIWLLRKLFDKSASERSRSGKDQMTVPLMFEKREVVQNVFLGSHSVRFRRDVLAQWYKISMGLFVSSTRKWIVLDFDYKPISKSWSSIDDAQIEKLGDTRLLVPLGRTGQRTVWSMIFGDVEKADVEFDSPEQMEEFRHLWSGDTNNHPLRIMTDTPNTM
ncbi:hypothetical protein HDU76_012030, partial [Blyttiomyces sp. JEL0837]